MMCANQNLKNRIAFGSSLDKHLWLALEQLHQTSRIPKSRLLDEAIELLLQHRSKN